MYTNIYFYMHILNLPEKFQDFVILFLLLKINHVEILIG